MFFSQRGAPTAAPYSAAKAAIQALTRSAAKEWAHIPIRCITIAPGPIETPLLKALNGKTHPAIEQTALNRIGQPEGNKQ